RPQVEAQGHDQEYHYGRDQDGPEPALALLPGPALEAAAIVLPGVGVRSAALFLPPDRRDLVGRGHAPGLTHHTLLGFTRAVELLELVGGAAVAAATEHPSPVVFPGRAVPARSSSISHGSTRPRFA